jgi:hypothetical protein
MIKSDTINTQEAPHIIQFEGPGWENDKVAFRSYFDERNGRDIFGKISDKMVLSRIDSAYIQYHDLSDWGMDILKVGNSLGAGSLAMFSNDSIYRLGKTAFSSFKKVVNGPVRSIFRLEYHDWKVADSNYLVMDEIQIFGGQYYYENRITLSGEFAGERELVSGITLMHMPDSNYIPVRNENPVTSNILYVYGKQSLNNDYLGMASVVNKSQFSGWINAPRIESGTSVIQTTGVKLKLTNQKPVSFRFYACWEKTDPVFSTEKGFAQFLEKQCLCIDHPIEIIF